MKLIDQHKAGVFPEHAEMTFWGGAIPVSTRMTIPAREAIAAVSKVEAGAYYYGQPPIGLLWVLVPPMEPGSHPGSYMPALRLAWEPPYPGEREDTDMWRAADVARCPKCGAALVWYEAGYVPGYRVCAGSAKHHYIVS